MTAKSVRLVAVLIRKSRPSRHRNPAAAAIYRWLRPVKLPHFAAANKPFRGRFSAALRQSACSTGGGAGGFVAASGLAPLPRGAAPPDSRSCPSRAAATRRPRRRRAAPRVRAGARAAPPRPARRGAIAGASLTSTSRSPRRASGNATTACRALRVGRRRDPLGDRQRHHLAGDLGEALGAAGDRHKALVVDAHDVAGVVPALLGRLQHARRVGQQIAGHHVRPAQQQPAALVDARRPARAGARSAAAAGRPCRRLKCIGVLTAMTGEHSVTP